MARRNLIDREAFAKDAPNMTLKQLAAKYGITPGGACNICRKLGVPFVRIRAGQPPQQQHGVEVRYLTLAEAIAEQQQARKSA